MILSMTAFARSDQQTKLGSFSWEIRSVNSRYLELHFRLPDSLRAIESNLRELLAKKLTRGKVECSLKFTPALSAQSLSINEELVSQLNQASDQVHNAQHGALLSPSFAAQQRQHIPVDNAALQFGKC